MLTGKSVAALSVSMCALFGVGFPLVSLAASAPTPDAGSTLTVSPTALTQTTTLTTTPTSVPPTATVTASPRPSPRPEKYPTETPGTQPRHRHHRRTGTPTPASLGRTPTPSATSTRHKRAKKHHRKATPTPTPTPSPTPALNLHAEDSITPVTCNGPSKPDGKPFLTPPYRGWTSLVSYFDHDSPNFLQDGLVITTTGLEAKPDGTHQASDFPAYWDADLRQFVYYDGHNGYDYNLSYQPVYAAATGKVIFAAFEYPDAPDHGYGRMVMINHQNGYVTLYGHFSKLLVKKGERVKRGQQIGISGNTGHSSGPHLHFTVFHNCTASDPYGWWGGGPDPLSSYQGESSTYLWVRSPLIDNPPPGWPGLQTIPPTSDDRLLLLRLPSTRQGAGSFTHALRHEIDVVRTKLGSASGVKPDEIRGALDIQIRVSSAVLYGLPYVASVAAMWASSDARSDVLHSLAVASLASGVSRHPLGRSRTWSGSLLQWQGRTYLLGRGPRAQRVKLRLARIDGHALVTNVRTDPSSGVYAVDLGKLSLTEQKAVRRSLSDHSRHGGTVSVRAVVRNTLEPKLRVDSRSILPEVLGGFLLLLVVALVAFPGMRETLRRRLFDRMP